MSSTPMNTGDLRRFADLFAVARANRLDKLEEKARDLRTTLYRSRSARPATQSSFTWAVNRRES